MKQELWITILNLIIFGLNVTIFIVSVRRLNKKDTQKFPKWEYFKDGLRFYNEKGNVTIENDKPLRK